MRSVEFRRLLDEENALRIRFDLERGRVVKFVVQLECDLDKMWIPVVRYDTAHGFAHCDILHPYEATTKTTMAAHDYNEALTFAIDDLTANWQTYRRRYGAWRAKR